MNKKTWWILGIVLALIIATTVFFIWRYYSQKQADKKTTAAPTSTSATSSNVSTDESTTAEVAQNGAGWKIYKNFAQGFLIEYPDGAKLENAGEDISVKPESAECVKISTSNYYVIIASRKSSDPTICLRTGVGSEWVNAPDETVTAAGQTYTAKGMLTESASAGNYEDFYGFTALSGEGFDYGIMVNTKYTEGLTKTQAKDTVHKILASFSPAE